MSEGTPLSAGKLLMGASIRQPSPLSQRKTCWKHAACQRLIRKRSSIYTSAERNTKSLFPPREGATALHTAKPLCVHDCVTIPEAGRKNKYTKKGFQGVSEEEQNVGNHFWEIRICFLIKSKGISYEVLK